MKSVFTLVAVLMLSTSFAAASTSDGLTDTHNHDVTMYASIQNLNIDGVDSAVDVTTDALDYETQKSPAVRLFTSGVASGADAVGSGAGALQSLNLCNSGIARGEPLIVPFVS